MTDLPTLVTAALNATRADECASHEWLAGRITGQEREAVREAYVLARAAVLAAVEAVGS